MVKGNNILISEMEKNRRIEGFIQRTTKPGTCMEIDWSVAPVNGDWTWEPYGITAADGIRGVGADGDRRLVAVLLNDTLAGQAATTAYAGTSDAPVRCFLYVPVVGEELNMLIDDIGGTGDDLRIADILMIDDGTGRLIETTGDPESEPFIVLEALTNPMADTLLHCMYTGQ